MSTLDASDLSSLLTGCRIGDSQAIETLILNHQTGVFRLALSILNDPAEAAEITQETFIAAIRSLPAYQEKSSFKAWLYTIALNLSRSRLRKQKRLVRLRTALASLLRIETQKFPHPEEIVVQ